MLKPNRLLIVDRDESTRALLRELCESWNFSVTLARDGNEAVQLLLSQKPDVLVLDLAMPGRDGFSVLKWVRENDRLSQTPVIVLTEADGIDEVVRAMDLGADDFVAKPLRFAELQTRINAALTVHRYRQRIDNESPREQAPSTAVASPSTLAASFDTELMHSRRNGRPTACLVFRLEKAADVLAEGFFQGALSSLRGADRLFRSDSNEFVALLPQTDSQGARQVAQRVLDAVMRLEHEGQQVVVRCGESAFPGRGLRTSADLLREARASEF